ncbi:cystatin-A-like [Saccostrea echinata]|uniref:cystatin-A-like n=1 Tax=Saccostrea echinata TaxID=191078 RepID=UPI002A833BEE|nr:cystatin-A-like [Saccostrea echinata]
MAIRVTVVLTLVCLAVISVNAFRRPGGLSRTKPATPEIQGLVNSVRGQIISKLPLGYDREQYLPLTARSYKEQIVSGKNYFIKIQTGPMRYIHVRIYKPLIGFTSVHSVQLQKSLLDPIEYF